MKPTPFGRLRRKIARAQWSAPPCGRTHTATTAPAAGRRPLSAEERAAAERMGAMLRLAIRSAGLPLAELGERAQVSDDTLRALGAGRRRTRRSTLGRICFALAKARPELGDP